MCVGATQGWKCARSNKFSTYNNQAMLNNRRRTISTAAIGAIDRLMDLENIKRPEEDERVPITLARNASYESAMRYTWRYVGNGLRHSNIDPMYKINKYVAALNAMCSNDDNVVQVDIGSGPGTFTWALLDWIRGDGNIPRTNVHVLAYDHCAAINQVAMNVLNNAAGALARNSITVEVDGLLCMIEWPGDVKPTRVLVELFDDADSLMESVQRQRMAGTHHVVTLGYVLANNYTSPGLLNNICRATSVTVAAAEGRRTTVVVCDTPNTKPNLAVLSPAWDRFIQRLRQNDLQVDRVRAIDTDTRFADIGIGR